MVDDEVTPELVELHRLIMSEAGPSYQQQFQSMQRSRAWDNAIALDTWRLRLRLWWGLGRRETIVLGVWMALCLAGIVQAIVAG